jgi:hypothetical protein
MCRVPFSELGLCPLQEKQILQMALNNGCCGQTGLRKKHFFHLFFLFLNCIIFLLVGLWRGIETRKKCEYLVLSDLKRGENFPNLSFSVSSIFVYCM